MSIVKDIPKLLQADVINQETADRIYDYYRSRHKRSPYLIVVAFSILGAILVGLGIILIIAHNWDEYSRSTKTWFAFLPMVLGQIIGLYILLREKSMVWKESGPVFLFFAIGAGISLISQIYHIPGNISDFLLTWMLLGIPLVYLFNSSSVSLLYLIGATWYTCANNYWYEQTRPYYFYWILLAIVLPHYYYLYKTKPSSNFMIFHNWLVPLSIVIALGTLADDKGEFMYVSYMSLFTVLYLTGITDYFQKQPIRNNSFYILGTLGILALLLMLSFKGFLNNDWSYELFAVSPEFASAVFISILAIWLLYSRWKNKNNFQDIRPFEIIFIVFILLYAVGLKSSFTIAIINLIILVTGLWIIIDGAKKDHLGVLNFGLIIIMILVICRFFDTDLSFILRGLIFLTVGTGFFATNYWMLKKRKSNEQQ